MTEIEIAVGTSMKVTCSKDELVSALSAVSRAVSSRSTVQVLSGVLIRSEGDHLELAATDMELSLRLPLEGQADGAGAVVVPGRLLVELARLLPEGEVTIEHRPEDGAVQVTGGSSVSRLHTYSAEDFPKLPDAGAADVFTVDRNAFLETIARVSRSASRDESRPVLTGILMRLE